MANDALGVDDIAAGITGYDQDGNPLTPAEQAGALADGIGQAAGTILGVLTPLSPKGPGGPDGGNGGGGNTGGAGGSDTGGGTSPDGAGGPMNDGGAGDLGDAQANAGGNPGPNPNNPNAPAGKPPVVAPVISRQRQERHIKEDPKYNGGGYFDNLGDAQDVLDAYNSGTATVLGTTSNGMPVVRVPGVIGTNVNPGAGFPNQPTDVFIIKGTSSVSVVPANPNWKP